MTLFQVNSNWKRHWFGLRLGLMIALAQSFGLNAASAAPATLPRKQPTADHRQ